jgi:Fic family protein
MTKLDALLSRSDELKSRLDAARPLSEEIEQRVLQRFRLWWTYHSNAIEGNRLTQGETEIFLLEGLTAKGKPLKDHLDLRGHSNAINYLLNFIRHGEVLTEAAIRELHKVLLIEPYRVEAITPTGEPTTKEVALGEYKSQPNHVRTPTGEIHFYATPEETPAKMKDLLDQYREMEEKNFHPLKMASLFHHGFTAIHPFDDGNGRMARLLMNLILMQHGYPPAVIRISQRDKYLMVLREADQGNPDGIIEFISEHVIASLDVYLRAVAGEEIHEPTDIEKEIALLGVELRGVEEPHLLTQSVQQQLLDKSVDPLFREIVRLLTPLCEFFADNRLKLTGQFGDENRQQSFADRGENLIVGASAIPRPEGGWAGNYTIRDLQINFQLKGFKKGRFETSDISRMLRIRFEPLKYNVLIPAGQSSPQYHVQHFYQESLSTAEIREIAQKFVRYFLDEIKRKAKSSFA